MCVACTPGAISQIGGSLMVRWVVAALVASVFAIAGLIGAGSAAAATATFTVRATAAAEVPTAGPAGASAAATLTVDSATGRICYRISTTGLTGVTDVHLHNGASGSIGPLVTMLDQASTALSTGQQSCNTMNLAPATAQAIIADPSNYYVNVHTTAYPTGAVRGQLSQTPDGVNAGSGGQAASSGHGSKLVAVGVISGGLFLALLCLVPLRRTIRQG